MADPTPKPTTTADEMHWVLYLREDIQEIRQDLRALSGRIDRLDIRMVDLHRRIDSRFGLLLMTMIALSGMTIGFMEYRLPPL